MLTSEPEPGLGRSGDCQDGHRTTPTGKYCYVCGIGLPKVVVSVSHRDVPQRFGRLVVAMAVVAAVAAGLLAGRTLASREGSSTDSARQQVEGVGSEPAEGAATYAPSTPTYEPTPESEPTDQSISPQGLPTDVAEFKDVLETYYGGGGCQRVRPGEFNFGPGSPYGGVYCGFDSDYTWAQVAPSDTEALQLVAYNSGQQAAIIGCYGRKGTIPYAFLVVGPWAIKSSPADVRALQREFGGDMYRLPTTSIVGLSSEATMSHFNDGYADFPCE